MTVAPPLGDIQSRRGAPFAADLIHANYADREIVLAGSDVFTWGDRGSLGTRTFTQANTAKDPLYTTFSAGKPALQFDGVDDFTVSPSINLASYAAITVAFAFQYTAGGLVAIMETSPVYSSNVGAFIVAGNGGTITPSYYSGTVQSRGFACSNGIHRLIFVINTAATGTITACYLDGVSVGSTPTGASAALGNYATYIGMRAGTSLPWPGKMGDMFVYGRALTAPEIATLDAWMAPRAA